MPQATRFTDSVYRSTTPRYATETDLLTGAGSSKQGGRWNPKGIAVVYASLTPATAMAETLAHNQYYGIPIQEAMPRTFVALDIKLRFGIDFRIGSIRQRLQVSEQRILSVDWRRVAAAGHEPITQSLGRAAYAIGLEALIVPSAADIGGYNLLVFPNNLRPASAISVRHADKLWRHAILHAILLDRIRARVDNE